MPFKKTGQQQYYPHSHFYAKRRYVYPILVFLLYLSWFSFMYFHDAWYILRDYWQASVTMIFGSFVAGSTAEGGAFIAFPVFTKLMNITSSDASTFGLMIQSIGMSFASLFIILYQIPVLYRVIFWTALGGIVGVIIGINLIYISDPLPKLLFTTFVFCFAIVLIFNRWGLNWKIDTTVNNWNIFKILVFLVIGIIGGIISSKIGIGINIITFILLTLAFGIHEKIATPTSVILMAIISLTGFITHLVKGSIHFDIMNYWLAAVPIVCIGAPLGAYVGNKLSRDQVILFLITLIIIEFISTIIIIPLNASLISFIFYIAIACFILFSIMIYYRYRSIE